MQRQAKRFTRPLTLAEQERLAKYREQIAAELPDLQFRDRLRKEAREEHTLSGELRRAIHASELSLAQIAAQVGLAPSVLDEFLTGERTLRFDVLDRLAAVVGYELHRTS
jgi:predicted transcriptional regulator